MPDFDIFSLLECKKVKVDPTVNVKMATLSAKVVLKNALISILKDLSIALNKHAWHGLFSVLSPLPISVLRNLEIEANKLYDRPNKLYKAARLTMCYVYFLSPYIDSEVNHKRHLIKNSSINKAMELFDLHCIFKDNLLISSIPNYFNNSETPIICYKCYKPIRSIILNFNTIVTDINIDSNTPDSKDCHHSNYLHPPAGHVITGNLNVIPDARVRNIISK